MVKFWRYFMAEHLKMYLKKSNTRVYLAGHTKVYCKEGNDIRMSSIQASQEPVFFLRVFCLNFRNGSVAMAGNRRTLKETAQMHASAHIQCGADYTNEFHFVGAALRGSNVLAPMSN